MHTHPDSRYVYLCTLYTLASGEIQLREVYIVLHTQGGKSTLYTLRKQSYNMRYVYTHLRGKCGSVHRLEVNILS